VIHGFFLAGPFLRRTNAGQRFNLARPRSSCRRFVQWIVLQCDGRGRGQSLDFL
jgi:hypothetical protein